MSDASTSHLEIDSSTWRPVSWQRIIPELWNRKAVYLGVNLLLIFIIVLNKIYMCNRGSLERKVLIPDDDAPDIDVLVQRILNN